MNPSSSATQSSSFSVGSSGNLGIGNLLADPRISLCSHIGDVTLELSDELPLGNLEWPRTENVGVGGPDTSDTLEKEPPEECAHVVVLMVRSSLDCEAPFRSATSFGKLSGLSSRMFVVNG